MNITTRTHYLLTATVALASWAGAQNPNPNPGTGQSGTTPQGTPPAHTAPSGAQANNQGLVLQRSDQLIGTQISGAGGQPIGRVEDVVVRPDGSLSFVVIQGTVDGKSHLFPIPWSSLQFQNVPLAPGSTTTGTNGHLTANFDAERLKTAPNFEASKWPTAQDNVFTEAGAFFGASNTPSRGQDSTGRPMDAGMSSAAAFRVSQLRNQGITDAAGSPIGSFGQFVIDPVSGRINYATMTVRDSANGSRVIAVPWGALQASRAGEQNQFQLGLAPERLNMAPQFQAGDSSWNQMSDPAWVNQMYSHYNVKPYWAGKDGERREQPQKPGQQPGQQPGQGQGRDSKPPQQPRGGG